MKKTGNDLFIVDNSDEEWKVLNYLAEWSEISNKFDIATGYFGQNHQPPAAATLAAEQMVQKVQLKAQKKAAKAKSKKAMPNIPNGATSLFDDLEDLAAAAGNGESPL